MAVLVIPSSRSLYPPPPAAHNGIKITEEIQFPAYRVAHTRACTRSTLPKNHGRATSALDQSVGLRSSGRMKGDTMKVSRFTYMLHVLHLLARNIHALFVY